MIADAYITSWARRAPWPTRDQVEQDLVLSRLIVAVSADALLGEALIFRGGTCLHKLHLPSALRYSEDLDYVRATAGPIGPILDAVRTIADDLDLAVQTDLSTHPKVRLRSTFTDSGARMQVKIEINTYERNAARDLIRLTHSVESRWWAGSSDVLTFDPHELVATKLRALYQRRKGRDLFDLWLALTQMRLDPTEIVSCFERYRPAGYTAELAIANLEAKVGHAGFRSDLDALVTEYPVGYSVDEAAERVRDDLLRIV